MNKTFTPPEIDKRIQKAWVVFSGQTDLPWLRILKKGFRHCYVLLNDGEHWVTIDPLSNYMDVAVHKISPEFDLPRWMQSRSNLIVPATITHQTKQAPWMVFTCVEAVKRVLGIHRRSLITPWQLYRYLNKEHQAQNPLLEKAKSKPNLKGEFVWEA